MEVKRFACLFYFIRMKHTLCHPNVAKAPNMGICERWGGLFLDKLNNFLYVQ